MTWIWKKKPSSKNVTCEDFKINDRVSLWKCKDESCRILNMVGVITNINLKWRTIYVKILKNKSSWRLDENENSFHTIKNLRKV